MAGDALEATTFGVIRAAVHRVTTQTAVRVSAVVFVGVDYDLELLMPSTGTQMPFGRYFEGMLVRTTPQLWSSYQGGELKLPYTLPEPHPFKEEPSPAPAFVPMWARREAGTGGGRRAVRARR